MSVIRQRNSQAGISLLELMITVVLISLGFLAAAKMQIQGSRYSQSSYYNSQAYFMLSDIMDRMRANREGVQQGAYDNTSTSAAAANPGCQDIVCTPGELALQDMFDLSSYLHNLQDAPSFTPVLPSSDSINARGEILFLGDGKYAAQMTWAEKIGNNNVPQTLRIEFAP